MADRARRMAGSDELITLDEAAARLGGISRKTLMRRIAEAGIRGPRPGRAMMLTEADYQQLLEATRARSPEPIPAPPPGRSAREALRRSRALHSRRLAAKIRGGKVTALDLDRKSGPPALVSEGQRPYLCCRTSPNVPSALRPRHPQKQQVLADPRAPRWPRHRDIDKDRG